jgi:site-specific DNA recombinase
LLAEEFSRGGVNLVFLQAPAGTTAEDQLVVQFQGMIAEYERAQIAERSRRGKRHKAQQGVVNVLSGAPYGYHYVKKSEASAGYYQVVEAEAQVVRWVFEMYTQQQLSLNAMARQLNQRQILTRSGKVGWRRQTIWHMLRIRLTEERLVMAKRAYNRDRRALGFCGSESVRRIPTR